MIQFDNLFIGENHQIDPDLNIHTWNPNDPCFDWKRPFFGGGLTFKNRGHLGSRIYDIDLYDLLMT